MYRCCERMQVEFKCLERILCGLAEKQACSSRVARRVISVSIAHYILYNTLMFLFFRSLYLLWIPIENFLNLDFIQFVEVVKKIIFQRSWVRVFYRPHSIAAGLYYLIFHFLTVFNWMVGWAILLVASGCSNNQLIK